MNGIKMSVSVPADVWLSACERMPGSGASAVVQAALVSFVATLEACEREARERGRTLYVEAMRACATP